MYFLNKCPIFTRALIIKFLKSNHILPLNMHVYDAEDEAAFYHRVTSLSIIRSFFFLLVMKSNCRSWTGPSYQESTWPMYKISNYYLWIFKLCWTSSSGSGEWCWRTHNKGSVWGSRESGTISNTLDPHTLQ